MIALPHHTHSSHARPFCFRSLRPLTPVQHGVNSRASRLLLGLCAEHRNPNNLSLHPKPVASPSIAGECINGFGTHKSLRDRKFQDKLLYLQSIGAGNGKYLSNDPSVIESTSLENIQNVLNYLRSMGLTNKDVGRIFDMYPELMSSSLERELRPVFSFLLREVKISGRDVPKVINRCPRLLKYSVKEQLRPTLYFLVRLGFRDLHLPTCQNSFLLVSSVEKKLIPKLEYMQDMGLSYKEAVKIVRRFPAFFGYSIANNVKPKLEYLVHEMGRSVDDLKAFPQYFAFSLEKRIKPRHLFLSGNNIQLPLSVMLMTDDVDFYDR